MSNSEEANIINETLNHIHLVQKYLTHIQSILSERLIYHDKTKLEEDELPYFIKWTPKLKNTTFGSPEYHDMLKSLKPALDHHYLFNPHHPEHFSNGINDMTLVDLIEAVCDWVAACKRHKDGDINKSIEISKKRFGIDDQLTNIIKNTVKLLE